MQSPATAALQQSSAGALATRRQGQAVGSSSSPSHKNVRAQVGEFVGNIFYGTLLREAQKSSLKGKYMHGGRGEEVFQGQLNQELAKKLGQAKNNPVADRLTKEIEHHLKLTGNSGCEKGFSHQADFVKTAFDGA